MKISKLAEKIDISLTKARRYAKELLPPDPEATRRSGKAREVNPDEGFIIFIGFHLVNRMGFSMHECKDIIDELTPWMERKGVFPSMKFSPDDPVTDYEVLIKRVGLRGGFSYEAKGLIRKRTKKIQGQSAIEELYTIAPIKDPPVQGVRLLDTENVSTLKVTILLKLYIVSVGGVGELKNRF